MRTARALMCLGLGILACDGGGTGPAGVAYHVEVYSTGWCSGGSGYLVLCDNAYVTDANDQPVVGARLTLAVDEGDVVQPRFALSNHLGAVAFVWEAHYDLGVRHLYGCARSDSNPCDPVVLFTLDYPLGSAGALGSSIPPLPPGRPSR